jgi:predicted membrane channel-forming protein YqfA (hemolysin III family)
MTQPTETQTNSDWKRFIQNHLAVFAVFIAAAVLAAVGAVYVFVWFVGNAQSTGLVPAVLSMWTMNNVLLFILHAIFWEIVLIGIPVAIGAIAGWLWYRRLPEQEKQQYNLSGKHKRSRGAGGGISTLAFIAFAIKVYVDGNWYVPIASFTLDYVVGSMITILIWTVAIFAIPAIVLLIWWVTSGRKKHP